MSDNNNNNNSQSQYDYGTVNDDSQDLCSYVSRQELFRTAAITGVVGGGIYWSGNKKIPAIQNMPARLKNAILSMTILGLSVLRSEQAMNKCTRNTQQVRYASKF
jgi:hypothetical protein